MSTSASTPTNTSPRPSTHDVDEHYMRLAIDASRAAVAEGNFPYGATLVSADGKTVHVSRNSQVTTQDCTGHAEVVLVREAAQAHGPAVLQGATVYASGEPCAMCSGAMFWGGVSRVVYAMSATTINELGGPPWMKSRIHDVLADASRPMTIEGPILEEEATRVMREFLAR
ncbi:nucleoside deaminase [Uliginosibacterium sp. H1]|uniref:nucleoside deaminase n=1 Tax=Uliginosibacterium sp. H1 TaxID=3114757 RepID=UPI002E182974|nr:nucleoside deaminase [Uliginosibacterium sp. H1]